LRRDYWALGRRGDVEGVIVVVTGVLKGISVDQVFFLRPIISEEPSCRSHFAEVSKFFSSGFSLPGQ
jgi:hypothetical protein